MENSLLNITLVLITLAGGFAGTYFFLKGRNLFDLEKKKSEAEKLLKQSEQEAKEFLTKAKKQKAEHEESFKELIVERQKRLKRMEESLKQREEILEKKLHRNENIKNKIKEIELENTQIHEQLSGMDLRIVQKLSERCGESTSALKESIVRQYQTDLERKNREKIARLEEELKDNAIKKAQRIIVGVIQRMNSPSSVETRAVHVRVPQDNVKGKIIGRKGCNIEIFEEKLDVDVIFNDLPNTISISAFNLVNRRIAQIAIEKLCHYKKDITQAVIEKAIEKATEETDVELYKIGKKAIDAMGMEEKDKELTRIIGRLQYRTSYGQNIMKHSMEVAWAAAMIGYELGLDPNTCKVAGFLHDLGKAIDQDPEIEDPHDLLSKKLMEKFGYTWEEVHAAWTHHDAIPQETVEAVIVKAADAISAGRPGARAESINNYFERIRALEEIATDFDGTKKAYAISAGRELRVFVDDKSVKDVDMDKIAEEMAEKIENSLAYPGQIKVNLIRKTEYLETAK